MKTSRSLRAAFAAVMVTTLLGGCFLLPEAETGPLVTTDSQVQIADEMYAHVAKLNFLEGVSARYEGEKRSDGYLVYSHGIFIDAADASNADLMWAIVSTWLVLGAPNVAMQPVSLTAVAGDKGQLDLMRWENGASELSEDQLTAEVQYWLDFGSIVQGPVYDSIGLGSPGQGYFRNISTMDELVDFDFNELHQLRDVTNGATEFSFFVCGIGSTGALPSVEEMQYGADIQSLKADAPSDAPVQVRIGASMSGQPYAQVQVELLAADIGTLESHERWPFVLEIVDQLAALPDEHWVGVVHVSLQSDSSVEQASVTIGQCGSDPSSRNNDTALFELLAAAELPDGSQAGACVRF